MSLLAVMTRRPRPLTNLADEDRVVLFPSLGHLSRDGRHWIVNVHGDVSTAARLTLGKRLLLKLLQRTMRASNEAFASELFQQRIARFVARDLPGRRIAVQIAGSIMALPKKSRRNGHFQAAIKIPREDLPEPAGAALVPVSVHRVAEPAPVTGTVRLLAQRGLSVITDIDDTLKYSMVACKRTLLANTFLKPFEAIPGMAAMFRHWSNAGAAVHYVSSSPWQLYEHLAEHLSQEGFPEGSYHLRAFRLRDHLLRRVLLLRRSGKISQIRGLFKAYPQRQFLLVGDSGEHDPEIYGSLARRFPLQVAGVCIRHLGGPRDTQRRYDRAFRRVESSLVKLYHDADELAAVKLPSDL
jgi:phosphatidate phosphatase APP1